MEPPPFGSTDYSSTWLIGDPLEFSDSDVFDLDVSDSDLSDSDSDSDAPGSGASDSDLPDTTGAKNGPFRDTVVPTHIETTPIVPVTHLKSRIDAVPLPEEALASIPGTPPHFGYGLLSQIVFLRSYARMKSDTEQETWKELVTRVMGGTWSIFLWHMETHCLPFDRRAWVAFISGMTHRFYDLEWLPAGRGLWMMGSDFVQIRGAASLNNCAAVSTENGLVESAAWAMDMLMNGGGVGFDTYWAPKKSDSGSFVLYDRPLRPIIWNGTGTHVIPDSREGWVWSVRILLNAYLREEIETVQEFTHYPLFDYSAIRAKGEPIRGFGGIASGPAPLMRLHNRLRCFLGHFFPTRGYGVDTYDEKVFLAAIAAIDYPANLVPQKTKEFLDAAETYASIRRYDSVRLIADIFNSIGDCVVSGNVRRSSEIAIGSPESKTFSRLKDFTVYPERQAIGHNSNNSVRFTHTGQYVEYLPKIVSSISKNGEPGVLFQLNITRQGRVSRVYQSATRSREFEEDPATLCNPCGEICLESKEMCNLSEVTLTKFLSRENGNGVFDMTGFLATVEYATFYCKCVSILPSHSAGTNAVVARNRRIGVSLSGVAVIYDVLGATHLIDILKRGYRAVRDFDIKLSKTLGVVPSIRVTTCKPSGTTSLLSGTTPGVHFSLTGRYAIRRIIIGDDLPISHVLKAIGVPHEPSVYTANSTCFSLYIENEGVRAQKEVGLYEMLTLVSLVQREWADNMVSTTVSFDPATEGPLLEKAIAAYAPLLKSCAFLPSVCGEYKQMPFESVDEETYLKNRFTREVDLPVLLAEYCRAHNLQTHDPEAPKYCDGGACEFKR